VYLARGAGPEVCEDLGITHASLKGKRFGVPAFIMAGRGIPFHGIPAGVPERDAGAEVVISDSILLPSFAKLASRVSTYACMRDGTDRFLAAFGPAAYHSAAQYEQVVGAPLFVSSIGVEDHCRRCWPSM
jgi:hypothetical protein